MPLNQVVLKSIHYTSSPDTFGILLQEAGSQRFFSFWAGACEGNQLIMKICGPSPTELMPYDYFKQLLELADLRVKHVAITAEIDNIFIARVIAERHKLFVKPEDIVEIDCRPSDAVLLATYIGCPIFVADDLLAKYGKPESEIVRPFDPYRDFWQNFIDLE